MTAFIIGAAIGGVAAYVGHDKLAAAVAKVKDLIARAKDAADDD